VQRRHEHDLRRRRSHRVETDDQTSALVNIARFSREKIVSREWICKYPQQTLPKSHQHPYRSATATRLSTPSPPPTPRQPRIPFPPLHAPSPTQASPAFPGPCRDANVRKRPLCQPPLDLLRLCGSQRYLVRWKKEGLWRLCCVKSPIFVGKEWESGGWRGDVVRWGRETLGTRRIVSGVDECVC